MMYAPRPPGRDGFTLIELMIVMVIVGVLAMIALPKFSTLGEDAKETEAITLLRHVFTLEERHFASAGRYTEVFADLENAAMPLDSTKYFQYRLRLGGSDQEFIACALPRPAHAYLASYQIDQEREIRRIDAASCTGNSP